MGQCAAGCPYTRAWPNHPALREEPSGLIDIYSNYLLGSMKIVTEFPELQTVLDEHAAYMSKLAARMNQQMAPLMKSLDIQTAPLAKLAARMNQQMDVATRTPSRHEMLLRDLESTPQRHDGIISHTSYTMYA